MRLGNFTKTPAERKRYAIDYSEWLDTGETISTFTLSIAPSGGMYVSGSELDASNKVLVYFVAGGDLNAQYTLAVQVLTSGGQIKEDVVLYSVRSAAS